jgi:hypothetical protein
MTKEVDIKALFDKLVAEGKEKNDILTAMIKAGVEVVAAVREYSKLAREAGLTMTTEQKAAKVEEVLATIDWETEDAFKVASAAVSEAIDVAPSTADGKVRAWCSDKGIVLSGARADQIMSRTDVVALLIANRGKKRGELSTILQGHGYAKGTADTITSHIGYMEEYARQVGGVVDEPAPEQEAA